MQMVDAMAPFVSAGVVDVQKLGAYVLQYGFGVKNPEMFMTEPPQAEMQPQGQQPPMPPIPMDQAAPMMAQPQMAPAGNIPPELQAMLAAGIPPSPTM
jgi:hypothetical protein